jgi:His-Xaa-Ser system protein HxsD
MNGISREGDDYVLDLDTSIYSLEAIKKVAYRFANRTSVIINSKSNTTVSVAFNFIGKYSKADPEQTIADFCNEIIDQDLREIIKRETTPIRNLILAHAFSKTSLVDN